MLLFWNVRYFDRSAKTGGQRTLLVETVTLEPALGMALELVAEDRSTRNSRALLKYRHLFKEGDLSDEAANASGAVASVGPHEYFEDEAGNEITITEIGRILTGNPDAVYLHRKPRPHDEEYIHSNDKGPAPVADVTLEPEEVRLFAYFMRDLRELRDSPLMKEGPGHLTSGGRLPILPHGDKHHQTSVTDDEIRSSVMIFRRLYMTGEIAGFLKAANLFVEKCGHHPLGKWVSGEIREYEKLLDSVPDFGPFSQGMAIGFNVKRLIDVFLYTQYAHQPDLRRERQFEECLQQVGNRKNFLAFLFLKVLWETGLRMDGGGRVVAGWFKQYCDHHGITPAILDSLRAEHEGLGVLEKEEVRRKRLLDEKIERLAFELWVRAGKPEGGPREFRETARGQITKFLAE